MSDELPEDSVTPALRHMAEQLKHVSIAIESAQNALTDAMETYHDAIDALDNTPDDEPTDEMEDVLLRLVRIENHLIDLLDEAHNSKKSA